MTENERSLPEQYYITLQLKAYKTASDVEPIDEFNLNVYVLADSWKNLKEVFFDEITMTKDFMRENDG